MEGRQGPRVAVECENNLSAKTKSVTGHEETVGIRGSVNREIYRLGGGRDRFVQGHACVVVHRYLGRDATDRTEITNEAIDCRPGRRHIGVTGRESRLKAPQPG